MEFAEEEEVGTSLTLALGGLSMSGSKGVNDEKLLLLSDDAPYRPEVAAAAIFCGT